MVGKFGALAKCAILVSLSSGLLIAGCSDESADKGEPNNPPAEVKVEARPAAPPAPSPAEQGVTVLSAPEDPAKDSDYHELISGIELLYIYGGNAPGGVDTSKAIDKIYVFASDLGDPELANRFKQYSDGDQFEKRDLAKQIEPILNENITKFRSNKYFAVNVQGILNIGSYDFDRQGYIVNNGLSDKPDADSAVPYNRKGIRFGDVVGYTLSFVNASDLNFIPMPDENAAKKLNEYMKQNPHELRLYGYIQSVAQEPSDSNSTRYVVMKIQKAEVVSSRSNVGPRIVFGSVEL